MSRTALSKIAAAAALGALLGLTACASEVDDPKDSSSILVITTVDPSLVEADIAKVVAPLSAETVQLTVKSIPRGNASGSELNDVVLESYSIVYNPPLSTGTASVTFANTLAIPTGGSASFTAIVVPVSDLLAGITPNTGATATIEVRGHDILGSPASAEGVVSITFNNYQDNNDADGDGIDDAFDPAPLDACNPTPCPP